MRNKQIILLSVLFIFGLLIFYSINAVINISGHYVYPSAEANTDFSIAKNFAESGVWGLSRYQFSSAASSPLFTFLLAILVKLFGTWDYILLAANLVAGLFLIWVSHNFFKKFSLVTYAVFLGAVVFLMPLNLEIMAGTAHVFYALAMTLALIGFQKYLASETPRNFSNMVLLSILATGFRYESLILIFFFCAYLVIIRNDFVKSLALWCCAIMPLLVYGWISVSHGSSFFPVSIFTWFETTNGVEDLLKNLSGNAYQGATVLILMLFLLIQIFIQSGTQKTLADKISKNPLAGVVFSGVAAQLVIAPMAGIVIDQSASIVMMLFALAPFADRIFSKKIGNIGLKSSQNSEF
ncbi:MAG: hypothetical protein L6262_04725 [Weeksellaceae bacterium]|nr:hypothetical protein [Weeksellaceae bacterium]